MSSRSLPDARLNEPELLLDEIDVHCAVTQNAVNEIDRGRAQVDQIRLKTQMPLQVSWQRGEGSE